MTNQAIPAEAVKAAHAAICEQNLNDCLDPDWRGKCFKAVEAAAPHMLAEVWDEGYTTGNAHNGRRDANPYKRNEPRETVIRDSSGRVLDRWIETDEDL